MDRLKECAKLFESLIGTEYVFTIGKKGKKRVVRIDFAKGDFHHLAGLHKIRDNDFLRTAKREKVFDMVLEGKFTEQSFSSSAYYNTLVKRLEALSCIKKLFESPELVFRYYRRKAFPGSKIEADYLITYTDQDELFLFLKSRAADDEYYMCESVFFRDNKADYKRQQERWTVLQIEKYLPASNEQVTLYQLKGYTG